MDCKKFLLLAELMPAQADDLRPIERFLLDYAARKSEIPSGTRLAGITLPQNPRGNAILDPADIYSIIAAKNPPNGEIGIVEDVEKNRAERTSAGAGRVGDGIGKEPEAQKQVEDDGDIKNKIWRKEGGSGRGSKGLWADLDVIPHITAKEQNADALRSSLLGLRALGLNSVLAVTGDKPSSGRRVFELDSIGLLELIADLNFDAFQRTPLSRLTALSEKPAAPSGFSSVPQFFALAAVSPFKYTEASLLQQYSKLGQKIRAGAAAVITQMGWDSRKSEELFQYLQDERLDIPVFGNVYFLSNAGPAARLMHDGQIPGCYVSDELWTAIQREKPGHRQNMTCWRLRSC